MLLNLTSYYEAISRNAHGSRPFERLIDVQTRFVYGMSRSLSCSEIYLCLEQLQTQHHYNRVAQCDCLRFLVLWLIFSLVLGNILPGMWWVSVPILLLPILRLSYLKRLQSRLFAIERCLYLLTHS